VPPDGIGLSYEVPGRDELVALYASVGWSAYAEDPAALVAAVENSAYVVAARSDGRLVGLARAVSDDVSICYVQDVLVHPGWQRRGVGRRLVQDVLSHYSHVRQRVLTTDAEPGQRAFYTSLGFTELRDVGGEGLRGFVLLR
jgi:GNAT superfamily N-acetyltransferase